MSTGISTVELEVQKCTCKITSCSLRRCTALHAPRSVSVSLGIETRLVSMQFMMTAKQQTCLLPVVRFDSEVSIPIPGVIS